MLSCGYSVFHFLSQITLEYVATKRKLFSAKINQNSYCIILHAKVRGLVQEIYTSLNFHHYSFNLKAEMM